MPTRLCDVHPLIKQIIDRDCHVGESNRNVIRQVVSKLKHGYDTFKSMSAAERRRFIDQCVCQHRANQRLYQEVMSGFSRTRRAEKEAIGLVDRLDPSELVELMEAHGKSSEFIAFRLGYSRAKLRRVLQEGIFDRQLANGWILACATETNEVPTKYHIRSRHEEAECRYCGYPMSVSDEAFEFAHSVFCSTHCARLNQGW